MNRTNLCCATFAVAGVLATTTANAQSAWYVGGSVGGAQSSGDYAGQVSSAAPIPTPGFTFYSASRDSGSDIAGRLFAGYQLLPWLAVEAGFTTFGEHQTRYVLAYRGSTNPPYTTIGQHRVDGATVDVVLRVPLATRLGAHARVGVMATRLRYDERRDTVMNGVAQADASDAFTAPVEHATRPRWGLGVSYTVSKRVDLLLDFERVERVGNRFAWTDTGNGRLSFQMLSFGLRYGF